MKLSKIFSAQIIGLKTHTITIEVDLFNGLHTFSIVGLPDKAIEESRDRVSSAIKSAGFISPKSKGQQKIVVSLAPANLKKEGPFFDLPIALGYLLASKDIYFDTEKKLFVGELSLGGILQPIKGTLLIAKKACESGFKEIYLPYENAHEAALIDGIKIFGAKTLQEIIDHLDANSKNKKITPQEKTHFHHNKDPYPVGLEDIQGQGSAKRGLQIAAAGGHNIAFFGPPGTGKTLLAKAFASILPPLTFEEALEVTGIHSATEKLNGQLLITKPPFRAPHHTSSYTSIIGGGTYPKPGEVTLAHRGVLFLDEFPEFDRRVIESLRQPLEDREVSISRARGSEVFPASFILIAALNPCPCGYHGDAVRSCTCSPSHLFKYRRKISGPIIDRIDMWIEVSRIDNTLLSEKIRSKKNPLNEQELARKVEKIKNDILKARIIQKNRFKDSKVFLLNSAMSVRDLKKIPLEDETKKVLDMSAKKLDLSPRSYHRIIKLAQTVADLDQSPKITKDHLLEVLRYRPQNLFE